MIGSTDHRRGRGVLEAKAQYPCQQISDREDRAGLYKQRNRNPQNRQWIAQDDIALEREQQNECGEQGDNGNRRKQVDKTLVKPGLTFRS